MTPETQVLLNLQRYYINTRQIGHTSALVHGAENVDNVVVLVHSLRMKQIIQAMSKNQKNIQVACMTDPDCLIAVRKPLLIDNAAMVNLLDYALQRISFLEKENYALRDTIK